MIPTISICIPAYKSTDFLKRLLDSIAIQTYMDFEVVVTDDSPGDEVQHLCESYRDKFPTRYFKNASVLNTPENWNESIRKASGKWIKLMHDDDWFSDSTSLQDFAAAIEEIPDADFFFSAYTNIYEETGRKQPMFLKSFWKKALKKEINVLVADNVIGPPSVTLHRNNGKIWYDNTMKYIVDIDFYIRYLQNRQPYYIKRSLINVGINKAQVTKYTFGVADVHLKESMMLLHKTGEEQFNNIIVFDGWWRIIRNFSVKSIQDIHSAGYTGVVAGAIQFIINFQKQYSSKILKNGALSKMLMTACYLKYRSSDKK
jgi:glycosyltransferase involved in cell wall biosynthesis